jgi:hypothetical protein
MHSKYTKNPEYQIGIQHVVIPNNIAMSEVDFERRRRKVGQKYECRSYPLYSPKIIIICFKTSHL